MVRGGGRLMSLGHPLHNGPRRKMNWTEGNKEFSLSLSTQEVLELMDVFLQEKQIEEKKKGVLFL